MKIIVCGAGRIGRNLISYLSQGNNDIAVIDTDQRRLDEVSKEWDILPVLGSASHPEILERAGASGTDLILAVTNVDEVNMIACQVGAYLFNIQRKIARIDSREFIDPLWAPLYNEKNIPIDLIISPDMEIADAVYAIIRTPGASSVMSLADKKLYLLSVRCGADCPMLKTQVRHFEMAAPDLKIAPVCVVRNGKNFIPNADFTLEPDDEFYFLVQEDEIEDALHNFGKEQPANEKILIFGGNQISLFLARRLEEDDSITSCRIIDEDFSHARKLASVLNNVSIISGEMTSDLILEEAGLDNVDVTIAVTLRDKENLLASLIAQKNGVGSTISLVNSNAYNNLVSNLNDSIIVDTSSVTVSGILKELRKAHLNKAYSLGRGFGEVWEIKIDKYSANINKKIIELELPENSRVCAVIRDEEIIFPTLYDRLAEGDIIILFCSSKAIKRVEKIFS